MVKVENMTDYLEEDITELTSKDKVLLKFYSVTCAPCRMISTEIAKLVEDNDIDATIYDIDVESCPELAGEYGVFSVPTLVFLNNGEEYHRNSGFLPKQQIKSILNK